MKNRSRSKKWKEVLRSIKSLARLGKLLGKAKVKLHMLAQEDGLYQEFPETVPAQP